MIININTPTCRWVLDLDEDAKKATLVSCNPIRGEDVAKQQGLLEKAAGYLKAEASALMGSVPLPVLEARKAACDGCDSARKAGPEEWYCKSCGCPEWKRSQLQAKWTMPAATCPLKKWPEIK